MSTKPKRSEIQERRKNVQLLLFNNTNEEIAAELKVSISTIKRDRATIVKNDMIWLTKLPLETLILDYLARIDQTKKRITELDKQFSDSTETEAKVQVSKEIRENEKFLFQLYDNAVVIYLIKMRSEENIRKN
ncbi:MAG: hypothetical protein ACREBI_00390 [Nitrosotalea sp.]